jgi:hypothetical protein
MHQEGITNYSVEQSVSWEANSSSSSQELSCILWNPKFHDRLSLARSMQSMTTPSCFSKIHFSIIFPPVPGHQEDTFVKTKVQELRFSQRCCWRWKSCGMLRRVDWVFSDVS